MGASCFRKLTFRPARSPKAITLFLSPDQSFLVRELFNIAIDPGIWRRRVAEVTQARMLADGAPARGSHDAKVTIVEFSDFECPYCRRFNNLLNSLDQRS